MVRRAAVLGIAALALGCTHELILEDLPDAGERDASPGKDSALFIGDASCGGWEPLTFIPRAAQLMVVLDRSSAMQDAFGGTTRQDAAESALMDAINRYQIKVKFGFEQFPADSNDKFYGDCQRSGCCASSVKVSPQYNTAPYISGLLQCGDPGFPCPSPSYETASNMALAKVRDDLKSRYSSDDRYVLLVTASEPYCYSGGDACDSALNAANDLGDLGVRLIVVSVGYQPTPSSCLLRISQTGSPLSPPPGTSTWYTPTSPSLLNSQLSDLVSAMAETACTMDLHSSDSPPPDGADVTISVGNTEIPQVDSTSKSGWSFANHAHTRIVLSGTACDEFVRSQSSRVSASYACSSCGGSNACPWVWQP